MQITFSQQGETVEMTAVTRDEANPFSTGSLGFNGNGKVTLGGKLYQVACNLIEVDSYTAENKRTADAKAAAKAKLKDAKAARKAA
jgi:hypothetical protein